MIRYLVCTGKRCRERKLCSRFNKYEEYKESHESVNKSDYYVLDYTPLGECLLFSEIKSDEKSH